MGTRGHAHLGLLVFLLGAAPHTTRALQATFELPPGTPTLTQPLILFSPLEGGSLVERTDRSTGGFLIDATGDGTADDVFVANFGQANEVLLHDGAGGYSRLTSGPLVERTDNSYGGFLIDATGDGTADDVFVANDWQANEIAVRSTCLDGYATLSGACCKFASFRFMARLVIKVLDASNMCDCLHVWLCSW